MRTLARDKRGYPIPFIVLRDKTGLPQFTINDVRRTEDCRTKRLCSICGKRFDRHQGKDETWFVGGSRCFLHERGAFVDPPVHLECAEYALRVCPFLAAPYYAKRIDDAKLAPDGLPDGMALARADYMPPQLPERFGLGLTLSFRYHDRGANSLYTVARWEYVEFWRAGQPIEAPESSLSPPDPRETHELPVQHHRVPFDGRDRRHSP